MLKFIFSVFLIVAIVILILIGFDMKKNRKNPKLFFTGAVVAASILILSSLISIVPAGYSGVRVTAGKVSPTVLSAGPHFKIPVAQSIVNIDNRIQRTDVTGNAASKDLQNVSSNVSVNYRVQASESANLYSNIGSGWDETVVRPAVQESLKAVMAQFTAEELITKRQETSTQIAEIIAQKIEPYGLSVSAVNILSMDFSAEFNAAIEAKQTAQQNALKAEQDLARIEVEAQQKVVQAEADAKANRIRSESITDQILMSEFLEKWDGKMPYVVGNESQILDISSLISQ